MDKFSFISLWDVYNGLLTPVQQEITDLYFNMDLTLSEIAAEKGISRQAVSECMKTCKKQLEEYEEKLHFCQKFQTASMEYSFMLTDAVRWAENFKSLHPEFEEDINGLSAVLHKDYSEEVSVHLKKPEVKKLLKEDYTEKVYGRKKTGEE